MLPCRQVCHSFSALSSFGNTNISFKLTGLDQRCVKPAIFVLAVRRFPYHISAISPISAISLIPEILLLIKQIRPTTAQIDNLRTPVPVLL